MVQAAALTSFSFAPVPVRPISSTASMVSVLDGRADPIELRRDGTPRGSQDLSRRCRVPKHHPDEQPRGPRADLELPDLRHAVERDLQLDRVHADPAAVARRAGSGRPRAGLGPRRGAGAAVRMGRAPRQP